MGSVRQAKAEQQRETILDAAMTCLVRGGLRSDRLLSAIAREAGISRPTLYRYFDDYAAIRDALTQRELASLVERLLPLADELTWDAESFGNLIGFIVTFVRDHPLFNAAPPDGHGTLPAQFAGQAFLPLRYAMSLLKPRIEQRIADGAIPPIDIDFAADLFGRIILSFTFTNGLVQIDTADDLRDYLKRAVTMVMGMAVTAP
ncbi:TetR/AcrR family transcriptional regulator [Actinokineospora pegani]|uniref:TetR/AcrR family transcriptional regulator n=1 Tax=Actinokineospora pegani TaxID=2654637 RepID=UPI0012EA27CA|nr:TetR/AcrR family transcriptional regulator [Actinokineospora pegani]